MKGLVDQNGRELGVTVWGDSPDDITIDDIWYEDNPKEPVPEAVVEYVYDNYEDLLYELWWDSKSGWEGWED